MCLSTTTIKDQIEGCENLSHWICRLKSKEAILKSSKILLAQCGPYLLLFLFQNAIINGVTGAIEGGIEAETSIIDSIVDSLVGKKR